MSAYRPPFRVECFAGPGGFDWSIGPRNEIRTWFAIWWTRRIDCGIAFGRRTELRLRFGGRRV